MRCSSSSALAALALLACVTTTTRYYLRSAQNPLYTPPQAESVLADYVRVQCPGLQSRQLPDTGSAQLLVDVDSAGVATRAQLLGTTRDDLVDGIFGTVAAQLRLSNDATKQQPRHEHVRMSYRCAGDSTTVHVEQLDR